MSLLGLHLSIKEQDSENTLGIGILLLTETHKPIHLNTLSERLLLCQLIAEFGTAYREIRTSSRSSRSRTSATRGPSAGKSNTMWISSPL